MPKVFPDENPFTRGMPPFQRLGYDLQLQQAVPNAPQQSLLLDLPSELRNRVYELVLLSVEPVQIDVDGLTESAHERALSGQDTQKSTIHGVCRNEGEETRQVIKEPGLLHTCRMIRTEAVPMYYTCNAFMSNGTSHSTRKLIRWIYGVSPQHQALLRDIRFSVNFTNGQRYPSVLAWVLELLQSELDWCGAQLKSCAIRAFHTNDGPRAALTKMEMGSQMTDDQWALYRGLQWEMEMARDPRIEKLAEVLGMEV